MTHVLFVCSKGIGTGSRRSWVQPAGLNRAVQICQHGYQPVRHSARVETRDLSSILKCHPFHPEESIPCSNECVRSRGVVDQLWKSASSSSLSVPRHHPGYDIILKQLGWLPEPVPVQDGGSGHVQSINARVCFIPRNEQDDDSAIGPVAPQDTTSHPVSQSEGTTPTTEQTVTVETDLVQVTLANRGGIIKLGLKRYRTAPPESRAVQLVYQGGKFLGLFRSPCTDSKIRERRYRGPIQHREGLWQS